MDKQCVCQCAWECVCVCVIVWREERGRVFVCATFIHHVDDGEKFKGRRNNGLRDLHKRCG